MKNVLVKFLPFLVVVFVALAGPGISHAYAQSGPFDLTSAKQETSNIVKFLIGALMAILGVAGGSAIVHGLVTARRKGEWGEFLGGVAMAVIAFIAFVGFLKMGKMSADPMNDTTIQFIK